MDLRQIECFVAVAEERSFTRAAHRLRLVQSGLSQAVRTLEAELGGPLFARSTRRVDITPAGRVFLPEAYRVLAAVREARRAVGEVHGLVRGQLRLGSIPGLAPFVDLPATLGRFRAALPGIEIEFRLDGAVDLLEEVAEGRLDVVFTQPGTTSAGMTCRMLACEDLVLVTAPGATEAAPDLAGLAERTFVDLRPDWGLRRLIDRSFADLGLDRRTEFEVNDVPMLLDLVAQGLGVALVPESMARARAEESGAKPVAVIELAGEAVPCWEIVVAFKGRNRDPADRIVGTFLDLLASSDGAPVRYHD